MSQNVTNELIDDVLKQLQADMAEVEVCWFSLKWREGALR
jgi:hypothetical protein